jgi:hypothetical protein
MSRKISWNTCYVVFQMAEDVASVRRKLPRL